MWYLISQGLEKKVLLTYLFATLLNLFLNLLYVPIYGIVAAAIVTGITELFIFQIGRAHV